MPTDHRSEPPETPSFAFGDRVQVSDDWFVEEQRGLIGTVAVPPRGAADRRNEGVYWVKFDGRPGWREDAGWLNSAEIDVASLRRISDAAT
jgi:hypothetical protein